MNMVRRIVLVCVAAAAALAVTGCAEREDGPVGAAPRANTVTAEGMGKVAAAPDLAVMNFGVSGKDDEAGKALAKASAAAKKVSAALRKQGVAAEDIQTANVYLEPQYRTVDGQGVPDGFQAHISVTAKLRDLDKIGAVITALTAAGARDISGPSFSIDEDGPYRADAIEKAVEDARSEATGMAKAAGKSVGEVLSITNTDVQPPVPYAESMYDAAAMRLKAADVPIETGTLDVTSRVTVVFALK